MTPATSSSPPSGHRSVTDHAGVRNERVLQQPTMRMTTVDVRSLPGDAVVGLRRQAVAAVASGMSQIQVAQVLGVSRKTVGAWVRSYREHGEASLPPRKRGRRPGEQLALTAEQQSWSVKTIMNSAPEDVGLCHRLWNRQAVVELINREFRICLTPVTVGKYLHRWGLLPDSLTLLRATGKSPQGIPRQRASGRSGVETLRVAWLELDTLDGHVLVAVSGQRSISFMTSVGAFDGVHVRDFAERVRSRHGDGITLVACRWPLEHVDTLLSWLADDASIVLASGAPNGPSLPDGPS